MTSSARLRRHTLPYSICNAANKLRLVQSKDSGKLADARCVVRAHCSTDCMSVSLTVFRKILLRAATSSSEGRKLYNARALPSIFQFFSSKRLLQTLVVGRSVTGDLVLGDAVRQCVFLTKV